MYSNEIGQRQQVAASLAVDSAKLRTETGKAAGPNSAAGSAGTSAVARDEAHISAAASQVASQVNGASAGQDVRMEKVAALQLAIQNGHYKVPSSEVADKLIQSMSGGTG